MNITRPRRWILWVIVHHHITHTHFSIHTYLLRVVLITITHYIIMGAHKYKICIVRTRQKYSYKRLSQ